MAPFLSLAKKVAKKSWHKSFFHSAVLIRGGSLIATGYNKGNRHAEMACIGKAWGSEVEGCTLLSIRVTKGGLLANGKPCFDCEQALRKAGIKKIMYSTADRTIEEMRL